MTVEHRPDAAVALLARRRFDVALLALDLGSTDGLALMRALQARSPGLPVLFLVPEGARDRVARAIREGAADCVGTPIVPEEVGVRVSAALAAGRAARDRARSSRRVRRSSWRRSAAAPASVAPWARPSVASPSRSRTSSTTLSAG